MTVLPILIAPDPRLKTKARPVGKVDDAIRRLMDDLMETMYLAPGVGLAAPQVGIPKRIITIDTARDGEERKPYRMADPEIVWASEEESTYNEGCLSLPEYYADVTRPTRVRVRYRDENDKIQEIEADGLLATCVQHEIDHLNGILFVDYLSPLKRNIILRKLTKSKKAKSEGAEPERPAPIQPAPIQPAPIQPAPPVEAVAPPAPAKKSGAGRSKSAGRSAAEADR